MSDNKIIRGKYYEYGTFYTHIIHENMKIITSVLHLFYNMKYSYGDYDKLMDMSDQDEIWKNLYEEVMLTIIKYSNIPGLNSEDIGSSFISSLGRDFRNIHHMVKIMSPVEMYDVVIKDITNLEIAIESNTKDPLVRMKLDIRFFLIMLCINKEKNIYLDKYQSEINDIKKNMFKKIITYFPPNSIKIHQLFNKKTIYLLLDFGDNIGIHFPINRTNLIHLSDKFRNINVNKYEEFCKFLKKHNIYHFIQYM